MLNELPKTIWQEPRWAIFRALAMTLGVKADTVKKWRQRQTVPTQWHFALLTQAEKCQVGLSHDELAAAASSSPEEAA